MLAWGRFLNRQSSKRCAGLTTRSISAGFRFRFAQSNVPVTTSTPSGNSETVTSTYFCQSISSGCLAMTSVAATTATGITTITTTGPTTASNTFSPAIVWSPCGG
ncbi:hypothetical protein FA13DRAFT_550132 [Coprinellus micaceus]|uniref:Uncharacterized protein n=1 Tax=Coprinellus micaceus TaxID=71717 RepID=A0A4Y7T8H5_COPMI|nr:hypothetical protein FA13DRAFT_550132 [Coprinellus micaceus]